MTPFQATLAGYGLILIGAGLALAGAFLKNDALAILGGGLAFAGLAALKLPRPQDV